MLSAICLRTSSDPCSRTPTCVKHSMILTHSNMCKARIVWFIFLTSAIQTLIASSLTIERNLMQSVLPSSQRGHRRLALISPLSHPTIWILIMCQMIAWICYSRQPCGSSRSLLKSILVSTTVTRKMSPLVSISGCVNFPAPLAYLMTL